MTDPDRKLFSREQQDNFWSGVSPDMRELIQFFESKEDWTVAFEQTPEFYADMESLIPELQAATGGAGSNIALIDRLIRVVGAMPLGACISALSWLDKGLTSNREIQWASSLYLRSCDIVNEQAQDAILLEYAKILKERVHFIVRMNLIGKLFTELHGIKA